MYKKQFIIWLLAGFLIMYHTVKIYSDLVATDDAMAAVLDWSYTNSIRLWIICSLLLVIMFKRLGVLSMWLSILVLVAMQYMNLSASGAAYFAPLRGLIIPAIITALFWQNRMASNDLMSSDKKKPIQ